MRVAIIKNGIVDNVIEADDVWSVANDGIKTETAGPGWTYDGTTFAAPILTAEEVAVRALAVADSAALAQAKADATINYLVTHTPAEITARVRQLVNAQVVTNLATAQASISSIEDMLVRIAIALSVTAKDKLR